MRINAHNDITVQRTENGFLIAPRGGGQNLYIGIHDIQVAETVDKLTSILTKWGNAQSKAAQPK